MRRLVIIILCALAASHVSAGTQGKKFIQYGWGCPDTAYARQHVQELEKAPFDGVVISVNGSKSGTGEDTLGWRVFSKVRTKPEDYKQAIADLKATKFKRLTDNFIQVISMPGDVDWFDPEWSAIAHNAACLARVAKQGGCKGIMFDPELYGSVWPWCYARVPEKLRAARTYEIYRAKVRQRGREFIRAINKEFPDITILTLFGPSLPYFPLRGNPEVKLDPTPYGLLAAFYDGILDAATPQTVLVDGYEFSYNYRRREEFEDGRRMMLSAKNISANPKEFDKHVRVGFGVWADFNSAAIPWNSDDFTKNYFTPAGLRASLNYALDVSDCYVWVYTERFLWWGGKPPAPPEYVETLRTAKLGPGPGEKNPLPSWIGQQKASKMGGYSDDETFADMRKTMTEIYDMPKDDWRFAYDKPNNGAGKGWYREDFDDSRWTNVEIGKFWEEQVGIGVYDGRAWYRRSFTAPTVEPGKRVFLVFGAVDDAAKVWLNGRFLEERDAGWDKPFTVEVTRTLQPGEDNVMAVQVIDGTGYGGIWKSVKLMVR
ncbi:MAG: hypothetical protein Q7T82_18935 [Armatimonadota bacterium]|nr:hypothetical protein [Armatimonadota bacterium]